MHTGKSPDGRRFLPADRAVAAAGEENRKEGVHGLGEGGEERRASPLSRLWGTGPTAVSEQAGQLRAGERGQQIDIHPSIGEYFVRRSPVDTGSNLGERLGLNSPLNVICSCLSATH